MPQTYMIDTDTAIALIRDSPTIVRRRFRGAHEAEHEVYLSSISLFELWYGVDRSRDVDANTERLIDFMGGPIEVVDFTDFDAARAGLVRSQLASLGNPIGPYDVLIAGQAARAGFTLVTGNVREFRRVLDLRVVDWTS